jgi:hypothetical protein
MKDYFLRLITILTLFLAPSCKKEIPLVNSEFICPNAPRILVKFVKADDLKIAIHKAYLKKMQYKTSENFTAVKLRDGRTLAFKGISPEIAVNCLIIESYIGFADQRYVHH